MNSASDKSARHPEISTTVLDWTDSLSDTGVIVVQALLQEVAPDIILGADVVSTMAFFCHT